MFVVVWRRRESVAQVMHSEFVNGKEERDRVVRRRKAQTGNYDVHWLYAWS